MVLQRDLQIVAHGQRLEDARNLNLTLMPRRMRSNGFSRVMSSPR